MDHERPTRYRSGASPAPWARAQDVTQMDLEELFAGEC
jgi:hypothetical protein